MRYQDNDYFLTSNEMLIQIHYGRMSGGIWMYVSTVYLTRGRRADNMHTIESMLSEYKKIEETVAKKWMRLNGHDI